jgi:hypothetical protein
MSRKIVLRLLKILYSKNLKKEGIFITRSNRHTTIFFALHKYSEKMN